MVLYQVSSVVITGHSKKVFLQNIIKEKSAYRLSSC